MRRHDLRFARTGKTAIHFIILCRPGKGTGARGRGKNPLPGARPDFRGRARPLIRNNEDQCQKWFKICTGVARNTPFDGFSPYLVELIFGNLGQKSKKRVVFGKKGRFLKTIKRGKGPPPPGTCQRNLLTPVLRCCIVI
jgi:hypothetical protein